MLTLDRRFEEIGRLPPADQWRLVNHILHTLEQQKQSGSDWQAALKATYGILADDPLERSAQSPQREPYE